MPYVTGCQLCGTFLSLEDLEKVGGMNLCYKCKEKHYDENGITEEDLKDLERKLQEDY